MNVQMEFVILPISNDERIILLKESINGPTSKEDKGILFSKKPLINL
jgi:hypothetical protein